MFVNFINRAFRKIDADQNDYISKAELREFLATMNSGHKLDEKFAIEELMKHFDQDSNHLITLDEFLGGCEKYVQNAKKLVADKTDSSKKYFPGIHRVSNPAHPFPIFFFNVKLSLFFYLDYRVYEIHLFPKCKKLSSP